MLAALATREPQVRARARREYERERKALLASYREQHDREVRELNAMLTRVDEMLPRLSDHCLCEACKQARAREARKGVKSAQRRAMTRLARALKGTTCSRCGEEYEPRELHFHHIDPIDKAFNLAQARNYSEAKVRAEAAKCIVLCRTCHFEEHPHLAGDTRGYAG